ncbi:putative polyketide cyclase [Trichinella spiralis]|uniref:putative polyketide cyclase n=1 Tax=Trichinella spiralis TaxID=6334 RepID=UPI0001EFCA69|nr:putative polyketide cyclase [Trichinella spiralis]
MMYLVKVIMLVIMGHVINTAVQDFISFIRESIGKHGNLPSFWRCSILRTEASNEQLLKFNLDIQQTTKPDQPFHSSLFNSDSEHEANALLHGDAVDSYFNAAAEPTNTES